MPRRDGTGPDGRGPRTGRGLGPCPREVRPEDPPATDAATGNADAPANPQTHRHPGRRTTPSRPTEPIHNN